MLALAARVTLRLSLLPGPISPNLPPLLHQAVECLRQLEKVQTLPTSWEAPVPHLVPSRGSPPHGASGLHEIHGIDDPMLNWGEAVESLWRVSMQLEKKTAAWDALTSRLLIWRAIIGAEGSATGEWVRREVASGWSLT